MFLHAVAFCHFCFTQTKDPKPVPAGQCPLHNASTGQLPTATLQNVGENLPRRVEVIVTAKVGLNLVWDVSKSTYGVLWGHMEQIPTTF